MSKKSKKGLVDVTIDGKTYQTKSLSCPDCGEPLTHSSVDGMFCDNECERAASIAAKDTIDKLMGGLLGLFDKGQRIK